MKRSVISIVVILIVGLGVFFNGCVKDDPEAPAETTIPFDPDKVLTIGQIKNMMVDSGGIYTFKDNYSFRAVVVMDESSGNIYKSSFVQDETGGIQLNFFNPGGLYVGDSIQVLLNGATIETYYQLYQLQNLDVGKVVYKIATGKFIEPAAITLQEYNFNIDKYQGTLVKFEDVQFADQDMGSTYADSANLETGERTLMDCNGYSALVRTSGYANFANHEVPRLKGSLIGIGSVYNDESQLIIRSTDEVIFTDLRCDGSTGNFLFFEGFDDGMAVWEAISVDGNQVWEFDPDHGNKKPCVVMTGYTGSFNKNDDWLISPSFDLLSLFSSVELSFETATFYNGNILEVKISTDYDELGDPSTATWNPLQPILSSGNWDWVHSGNLNISNFVGETIHVGFRYTSTNSACATWELDNIKISYEE